MANDIQNTKPVIDYVTAAQGKIFIGGILLDECYDIQYAYKETKEPIYGYMSKHWDAVLDGTVIVYGSFTINYKHDSYMYSILSKLEQADYKDEVKKIADYNDKEAKFSSRLRTYRASQKALQDQKRILQELESNLVEFKAKRDMEREGNRLTKLDLEQKLAKTKKDKQTFWDSLTPAYQEELNKKIEQFKNAINPTSETGEIESSLSDVIDTYQQNLDRQNELVSAKQMQIEEAAADIDNDNEYLSALKEELAKINAGSDPVGAANLVTSIDGAQKTLAGDQAKYTKLNAELVELNKTVDNIKLAMQSAIKEQNRLVQSMLDSDPNIKKAEVFELTITKLENEIKQASDTNATSLDATIEGTQASIDEQAKAVSDLQATLDKTRDELQALKDTGARDRDKVLEAMTNPKNWTGKGKRPEDFHKFNIMIEYNGRVHKVLANCELVGHSHAIMQSGEPIKEQYQFIAQKII